MGYEKDSCRVFVRITFPLHREIAGIADDMRIGHDARASYHEARSNSAPDGADVPGCSVIRLHFSRGNSNEALFNFAVRLFWRGNHDRSWWGRGCARLQRWSNRLERSRSGAGRYRWHPLSGWERWRILLGENFTARAKNQPAGENDATNHCKSRKDESKPIKSKYSDWAGIFPLHRSPPAKRYIPARSSNE